MFNSRDPLSEELAKYERHELPLTGGESVEMFSLQVFRNMIVELFFVVMGKKFFDERMSCRIIHVFEYLSSQGSLTDRLESIS